MGRLHRVYSFPPLFRTLTQHVDREEPLELIGAFLGQWVLTAIPLLLDRIRGARLGLGFGLVHHIATAGGTEPWKNPVERREMKASVCDF